MTKNAGRACSEGGTDDARGTPLLGPSRAVDSIRARLEAGDLVSGSYDEVLHSLEDVSAMMDVALPIGLALFDAEMRYVYINGHVYRQFGISPDELGVGDPLTHAHSLMRDKGLLTDDIISSSRIGPAHLQARVAGDVDERVMRLGDGRSMRLSRIRIANGYTVSVSEDVSDLVRTSELLESALELGKSGYWIYDFPSRTYQFSRTLDDLIRPDQLAELKRRGPIWSVHEDDREAFREAVANITDTGDRFEIVTRTSLVSAPFYFESIGRLHRFPDGRPHQLRCFTRNVTRERRAREELAEARDAAMQASAAKSQFLANMSHEIRTPMNGVLGMAELLAGSPIDERQREFVNVIQQSATSLLTVINDILDFSKIEADALTLDPVPFSLRDLVEEVGALLSPTVADKGLELVIAYPADVPSAVVGDPVRIRQVLTNLVGNAVKFTETGHVQVEVGGAVSADNRAELSLRVTDTGIGIEADRLERVFDKFTQADNSTTRIYGGTGLGLSIAKRLAVMMDGDLGVESVFGEGASFTFSVSLPLDRTARPVVRNTAALRGRRVLVVDDIEINRRVLTEQLGGWGMKVTTVSDGVEALLALRDAQDPRTAVQPFDIAVLDYLMPGVNGRELAAMIHAQPAIDLPVLMLSSCDRSDHADDVRPDGVDRHLVKPVREQALFDAMTGLLFDAGTPDDEAAPETDSPKAAPPEPATPARAQTPPPRIDILVAEDFPLNQDVVRLMLADTRYNPVVTDNGAQAVKAYADTHGGSRFRAVLMDVSMPVMDGYTATKGLAGIEAERGWDHVPVIALTGHALTNERETCLAAGMDDYLTKPVKQVELIAALDRWTGHESRIAVA